MADDDLISALNQAVKQEIIENYLRERRIVEEETNILFEACSAFQGGICAWEANKVRLARALITHEGVGRFFALAGLSITPDALNPGQIDLPAVRGLTRCRRYRRLVGRIYRDLWASHEALIQERLEVLSLRDEVNQDIMSFERNYDLLGLQSYLRSLNPVELQRRRLLGVNFTPGETAAAAAAMSFHPLSAQRLGLDAELDRLRPPEELLPAVQPLLRELCRRHPQQVSALWAAADRPA
ncbi:MAG: hypothetical protein V1797_10145 [Pseudomonadota bacterium]